MRPKGRTAPYPRPVLLTITRLRPVTDIDLWMTARCAADLQVDWPDDEGVELVQNDVVEKFVHLRSSDP